MPKRNPQENAAHQREKQKQGIISLEEAASLVEDPTYLDTETIDSFDTDIGARAAVLDLSKNTLKSINITEKKRAPEHWCVLTPSNTQFQPHLTNDTLKTALPAVSSLKRSLNPDLLPDWESQEVSEQCNCCQSKRLTNDFRLSLKIGSEDERMLIWPRIMPKGPAAPWFGEQRLGKPRKAEWCICFHSQCWISFSCGCL
jgi:hypothetical protein